MRLASAALLISSLLGAAQPSLITVASFPDRPGNVTVSPAGQIFATIHPLGSPSRQLVRVDGKGRITPFPSASWQRPNGTPATATIFDTLLGITTDRKGNVWVIDMGLNLGRTRFFAFQASSRAKTFELTFPQNVAPKGSFIQDLAVDDRNGQVYLADIANPGLLVVDTRARTVRRLASHPAFVAEDVDMKIGGKLIHFGGKPARVAVNPLTLSGDRETLYFGAMNGSTWYSLPTRLLSEKADDEAIAQAIRAVGPKPVSGGVATDAKGNHYFTNLNENGVDVLRPGATRLELLLRYSRLDWADNVALGPDGHLYITVNQLHKTPAFTGGADEGSAPYFIYKIKL